MFNLNLILNNIKSIIKNFHRKKFSEIFHNNLIKIIEIKINKFINNNNNIIINNYIINFFFYRFYNNNN